LKCILKSFLKKLTKECAQNVREFFQLKSEKEAMGKYTGDESDTDDNTISEETFEDNDNISEE
jgi:hypothetical protein